MTSLAIVLIVAAACAPSATRRSAPETGSPGASPRGDVIGTPPVVNARDGNLALTFTLTLDAVAPGNEVSALFAARNEGSEPISYPGGCQLDSIFWMDFETLDVDAIPEGRDWTGIAGELKRSVSARLSDSIMLGRSTIRPPEHGCDATGDPAILEPGQTIESIADWDGRLGMGYPAPPDTYVISGRFSYYPSGPLGDLTPIDARLPIDVLPVDAPRSPLEALDVALQDHGFASWLEEHPIESWDSYDLRYRSLEGRYELTAELLDGEIIRVSIEEHGDAPVTMTSSRSPAP